MTVRCDHCRKRRVLDELSVSKDQTHDTYSVTTMLQTSMPPAEPSNKIDPSSGLPTRKGITRPSVGRLQGAFGRPEEKTVDGHDIWLYACNRHCGAAHSFTEATITKAFLWAFEQGKNSMSTGDIRRCASL